VIKKIKSLPSLLATNCHAAKLQSNSCSNIKRKERHNKKAQRCKTKHIIGWKKLSEKNTHISKALGSSNNTTRSTSDFANKDDTTI